MVSHKSCFNIAWWQRFLLSALAGACLPFAFAPLAWSDIAVLAPAVYLLSLNGVSARRAALLGGIFGWAFFAVGVPWIYISIHRYGQGASAFAGLVTLGFITLLASYFAVQAYLLNRYYAALNLWRYLLGFPSSWVLMEYVRAHLFTGFPWLLLAYSQTHSLFSALLPIVGVYGVAYILTLTSAVLLMLILSGYRRRWRECAIYAAIVVVSLVCFNGLRSIHWTHELAKRYAVALVQGNIAQSLKWSPNEVMHTIDIYQELTMAYLQSKKTPHIVVWPEAAIPLPMPDAKPIVDRLDQQMCHYHSVLVTGIPVFTSEDDAYNALLVRGYGHGYYYKRHLVPFGEYIPGRDWFGSLFDIMHVPMSDFNAGKKARFLYVFKLPVAPFICYEIAYPHLVREFLPQAQLLMTVTDDAWFGDSSAQAQHLQIAQTQSLQTGRYQLFASNNGITAIIDAQGRIVKRAPRFQKSILSGNIYPMVGATPWVRWGDMPWLVASVVLVLCGAYGQRKSL